MLYDRCDIILPTCGTDMLVRGCIESLVACTKYPFRLIVINDGTSAEAAQYLDEVARSGRLDMRVIKPAENLGWIRAINRGLEESKDSKYVCFQNDDTVFTDGWLDEVVALFEKDAAIGIVNPEWEMPEDAAIAAYAAGLKRYTGRSVDMDYCRGHCFCVRREVIEKIGGFDTAYVPAYYDDRDYSLKAIAAGYRCVKAKGAFVAHIRNVSMAKAMPSQAVAALMERNGRIFYKRWGCPLRIVLVRKDFAGLRNLLEKLCADQNKVILITTSSSAIPYEHTNMKVVRYGSIFFPVKALAFLAARRSRKKQKGVDLVLSDDPSFCGIIEKCRGIMPARLVCESTMGRLEEKALQMIREQKDRDKESITV